MTNIFTIENFNDFSEKLNIDELYEKKQKKDLEKLNLYNKILNRIHVKIKLISKQRNNEQFCGYLVPEMIIGCPTYEQANCIAYLIDKLQTNGFIVRYTHPNLLFISWSHWVPLYIRNEIKKKTGIIINEYGVVVNSEDEVDTNKQITNGNINNYGYENIQEKIENSKKNKKEYTPIKSYKPSGNLIYDNDILDNIENKFI